jgi:hypothetical protein
MASSQGLGGMCGSVVVAALPFHRLCLGNGLVIQVSNLAVGGRASRACRRWLLVTFSARWEPRCAVSRWCGRSPWVWSVALGVVHDLDVLLCARGWLMLGTAGHPGMPWSATAHPESICSAQMRMSYGLLPSGGMLQCISCMRRLVSKSTRT